MKCNPLSVGAFISAARSKARPELLDVLTWPVMLTGAAVLAGIDGGRTLRWVRGVNDPTREADPVG